MIAYTSHSRLLYYENESISLFSYELYFWIQSWKNELKDDEYSERKSQIKIKHKKSNSVDNRDDNIFDILLEKI